MAVLSKRMIADLSRAYHRAHGLRPYQIDLTGRVLNRVDPLAALAKVRRSRNYALHESVNWGQPYIFTLAHSVTTWVVAIEDRRIVYGGFIGGEVLADHSADTMDRNARALTSLGLRRAKAIRYLESLPAWPQERIQRASKELGELFCQISGWQPLLMKENQLKVQQQQQIAEALEDQKQRGDSTAYPFEKERVLLSLIRTGDQNGTRQVLNEMLAAMYMSSPELVVLRARAIELMGYLTRTAVEDSPLMAHVIERNHQWMRRLIQAPDFEELSRVLTQALDDFIEGIYLHGFNRSNTTVSRALQFIAEHYMKPISLSTVAVHVGLSPFRVAHLVKRHTGKTAGQVIHQIRVQHARHLLERTSKSCTEVAYEVGYGDQSYFIKHFRRLTGVTPARYRRTCFVAPREEA